MSMTMKEYDGMLAVACIMLAVVLNALQISFIADGLVMASHQGYVMATLMAIVISSGFFYSVFASNRLWLKGQPRYYAWILGSLAGFLVGAMAAWSLSNSAHAGSARWWLALFIGSTIPAQTFALCSMTNGMLALAGPDWWKRRKTRSTFKRPVDAASIVDETTRTAVETAVDMAASTPVGTDDKTSIEEEIRAVSAVSLSEVPEKLSSQIVTDTKALSISISGDLVNVRVGREFSNRQWKTFHSELRRIPSMTWTEAQKAKSAEGNVCRTISGTMRLQPIKGKKNRQKRRAARTLQLDAIVRRLQELAEQHSSI